METTSSVGMPGTPNILLNDQDLNRHHIIQKFLLIWLDVKVDSSKGDDTFSHLTTDLHVAVSNIYTFMDIDECIEFLADIEHQKAFILVCDEVRDNVMPFLHQIPQTALQHLFCRTTNQSMNRRRRRTRQKSKVYSQI